MRRVEKGEKKRKGGEWRKRRGECEGSLGDRRREDERFEMREMEENEKESDRKKCGERG